MTTYRVAFKRIGRNHDVPPLIAGVEGEADLCRKIRAYARPHLRSKDFDVFVEVEKGTGFIACGMHVGAEFTIAREQRT